jgi:hypothetical protein
MYFRIYFTNKKINMKTYPLIAIAISILLISCSSKASKIDVNNLKTACEVVDAMEVIADRLIELKKNKKDEIIKGLNNKDGDMMPIWDIDNKNNVTNPSAKEFIQLKQNAFKVWKLMDSYSKKELLICDNGKIISIDAKMDIATSDFRTVE